MEWLIWNFEHNGWWVDSGNNRSYGYTKIKSDARRFRLLEALEIVTLGNKLGAKDEPREALVPDYDNEAKDDQ